MRLIKQTRRKQKTIKMLGKNWLIRNCNFQPSQEDNKEAQKCRPVRKRANRLRKTVAGYKIEQNHEKSTNAIAVNAKNDVQAKKKGEVEFEKSATNSPKVEKIEFLAEQIEVQIKSEVPE